MYFFSQLLRTPTLCFRQRPAASFRRALVKSSFGSFCLNCSAMRPIPTSLHGKAPTGSSSSLIQMKWPEDGENESQNQTWIMTNSAGLWGKKNDALNERILQFASHYLNFLGGLPRIFLTTLMLSSGKSATSKVPKNAFAKSWQPKINRNCGEKVHSFLQGLFGCILSLISLYRKIDWNISFVF